MVARAWSKASGVVPEKLKLESGFEPPLSRGVCRSRLKRNQVSWVAFSFSVLQASFVALISMFLSFLLVEVLEVLVKFDVESVNFEI